MTWLKRTFFVLFSALVAVELFFTLGCNLFQFRQLYTPSALETYRHQLEVKVNGVKIVGTGVAKLAAVYKIDVYPEGKIDRIMWRTCTREEVVDKPGSSWWGADEYSFELRPAAGLEDVTSCGLQITVLEEKKRRNGFAFIDFEDSRPEVNLVAKVTCNGTMATAAGVSVCQSAAGLYQQIVFESPVVNAGASDECDVMRPLAGDNATYRFKMPAGECSFYFVGQEKAANGKRRLHRLSTIGYTDVPPIKL